MKRNKFSKALKQLKSTELDERIRSLEEAAPTNSIGGVYALNQPGQRLGPYDPPKVFYPDIDGNWPTGIPGTEGETTYVRPAGHWDSGPGSVPATDWDNVLDFSHNGTSTDGFINPTDGTVLVNLPPDSRDFILGPLVDGYNYIHGYDDYTNIGYIQKDTRQFILLGRIQGYWKSGAAGNAGAGRNPVREWGGESDGFTSYNENFTLAMAQWFRDQYVNGTYVKNVSYFYSGGQPQVDNSDPDAPPGSKGGVLPGAGNGNGPGDMGPYGSGTGNGDPNIGTPQNPPEGGGPEDAGFPWDLLDDLKNLLFGKKKKKKPEDEKYGPAFGDDETANRERDKNLRELEYNFEKYGDNEKVNDAINDWNDALYKAGGGDAARKNKDLSRDEVIQQGRENLGLQKTQTSRDDFKSDADYYNYKAGGGDAAARQGKSQKEIINQGVRNNTSLNNTLGMQIIRGMGGESQNSSSYNYGVLGNLALSILTGQPQENRLSNQAKKQQINSVNPSGFEKALEIGKPPKPDTNNAVNPGNKRDDVLTGGWADQGGVEVHYNPSNDTLTITSNKMLRTGQQGDEFGKGQYGHPLNPIDYEKQTKFGDIPELTPDQVKQGLERTNLDVPLNALFDGVAKIDPREGDRMGAFQAITSIIINTVAQGTASNLVATRKAIVDSGVVEPSEMEKTGSGYGQTYAQTNYTGDEIPSNLRKIINNKTGGLKESREVLTESRKRILREIKQPYKLPEQPKQKYKMNFKGKFSPQNTPDVTACKQTDEEVKAKNAAGQTWRTKDKHWSRYESQERMNVIYDQVGHGSQYWDMIVNENQSKKGVRDRQIQEYLNIIAHEKAMLQEDPNYVSPFRQNIKEQETMQYDNDPLFKKVSNRLKKEIDYPDKPSKAGYPDTPPPEMVNGFHPEYGQKADRYNKLDPQSAEAMPPTGNPEIDAKVQKAKRLKKILGKRG